MQRWTTKSPSQDSVLNRVVTCTPFVLTHGVHGCPSFAACVRTDTSFTAASYLVPRCFASPDPMSAKEFHEALSLKHAVDRPPSTSLFTELLKLMSVTMITCAVSSLYTKFRIECMGLGPSLFGGLLRSCAGGKHSNEDCNSGLPSLNSVLWIGEWPFTEAWERREATSRQPGEEVS